MKSVPSLDTPKFTSDRHKFRCILHAGVAFFQALAVEPDLDLLAASVRRSDSCWESRLQCGNARSPAVVTVLLTVFVSYGTVFKIFVEGLAHAKRSGASAVVHAVIVPTLQLLQSLVLLPEMAPAFGKVRSVQFLREVAPV